MLHRKSAEVDKEGNVIGGELKKKCDGFILCLNNFKRQYLSKKFNSGTLSGKNQQHVIAEFKKWVGVADRQYSREKQQNEDYIKQLNEHAKDLERCCNLARSQKLGQTISESCVNVIATDYEKRCDEIRAKNAQIKRENDAKRAKYERQRRKYYTQMATHRYGMFPPGRPSYKKLIPLPSGPSVPQRMTDKMFDEICDIVSGRRTSSLSHENSNENIDYKGYVLPLLDMALQYCNGLIKDNDLRDPKKTYDWYLQRAKKENNEQIYWYLYLLSSVGDLGIPFFDNRRIIADVYWTLLFMDCPKAFKDVMGKFKLEKGGSSTKKWIEQVCKALQKQITGQNYTGILKGRIDNFSKSLKIKPPRSISLRPTIKQKPVQDELQNLSKYIIGTKQRVPFLNN